jgi:hypothetical protein
MYIQAICDCTSVLPFWHAAFGLKHLASMLEFEPTSRTTTLIRIVKIQNKVDGEGPMEKFLLGTVAAALVGMAAPAFAADMPYKAPPPAPYVAPIYDWTGFYIGGNGGWGQSRGVWISLTRLA